MKYKISHVAYLKMVLHSAKHPGSVNGVLLGQTLADGSEVFASDIIPLLHHWTSFSPMMEIGLDLARSNAEERQLKLVGYYQASDRPDDERVLIPVGSKVASILRKEFDAAFAIVIDSSSIMTGVPSLIPFLPTTSEGSWTRRPSIGGVPASPSVSPENVPQFRLEEPERSSGAVLPAIHEQCLHRQFGDFDDHLEDVSIDWLRNPGVSYLI